MAMLKAFHQQNTSRHTDKFSHTCLDTQTHTLAAKTQYQREVTIQVASLVTIVV